jgi:hypothetical protein
MLNITLPVEHAGHIKMLEIHVSFNLSRNAHVNYLRSKIAKLLGFLCRNIKDCTPKVKCPAYQFFIRPVLTHASSGCHPTTKNNLLKLQMT